MTDKTNEYLTFILDDEEYGISILAIQEIRVWSTATDVPNTPEYVRGVVNLRGVIVPIVDLRQRLGKQPIEYSDNTVVIVLKEVIDGKPITVGIVVDAVSDVYRFAVDDIKSAPYFGSEVDSRFIHGMATIEEKIMIILDAKKLLNVHELYQISTDLNKLAS